MIKGSDAKVWLVADDYGLSPAVSQGIRELIAQQRISGTGCMTLFPEWEDAANDLKSCPHVEKAAIGLHLTLTDFAPLTGTSPLAPAGRLPGLKNLIVAVKTRNSLDAAIHAELDAQLNAFVTAMGHDPHYMDGHQHVHFLRPVRSWLKARKNRFGIRPPWIRGAPSARLATGLAMKAKIGFVAGLAFGFNRQMRDAGYPVEGPLAGFYDWSDPEQFAPMLAEQQKHATHRGVVMCHPGHVDDCLIGRDTLVAARQVEWQTLSDAAALPILQLSSREMSHAG